MAILEVNNIEKHFGSTSVLKDVSFSLEEGSALAIIGSSGSGKTTLLRCLNFLETPNGGTIKVKGETLFDASLKQKRKESELRTKRLHFGMVFQSFNLFPQYTALENVTLAEKLLAKERPDFRTAKKEIYDKINSHGEELLAQMGLAERMDHYPHQLSGGQQQRVAIARALALCIWFQDNCFASFNHVCNAAKKIEYLSDTFLDSRFFRNGYNCFFIFCH